MERTFRSIPGPLVVNDCHSRLNRTVVSAIEVPACDDDVVAIVKRCRAEQTPLSLSGCRHAMGGQGFLGDGILLDLRSLTGLRKIDHERRLAEFGAGSTWTDVMAALWPTFEPQSGAGLSFRQKQTGADRLTLGGSVAVNAHGRGLALPPFVADVESLSLVNADGDLVRCSRAERPELFSLVNSGYGMFGAVTSVTLRLWPRYKVRRVVVLADAADIIDRFEERIRAGFVYGDFQFRIDPEHPRFLQEGVFSCYEPVPDSTLISDHQSELRPSDWQRLMRLAHEDPPAAFVAYSAFYLSTNNQIYWSDEHQMSTYLDGYHASLDADQRSPVEGSEMITELYVPRRDLAAFLARAAALLRTGTGAGGAGQQSGLEPSQVIYGTVRLINKDTDAFLTWARDDWACIVFNLHVDHAPNGLLRAQRDFLALIDLARMFGGSYFLTYHRWARKEQILSCHPRIRDFVRLKQNYDPTGLFISDWYRSLVQVLEGEAA